MSNNMSDRQFESHIWLSRMWHKEQQIDSYERRKADIISMLSGIGRYDPNFIPTNDGTNSVETKHLEYSILSEKLEKLLDEISIENTTTMAVIDNIKDSRMHSMLYDRYICRLSYKQLSEKYHYGDRQIYRYMHKCLDQIREFIPDDEVLAIIQGQDIQRG